MMIMEYNAIAKIAERYAMGMITKEEVAEELIAAGATPGFAKAVLSKIQ